MAPAMILGVHLMLPELNVNALLLELHFVFFSQENFLPLQCNVINATLKQFV